MGHKTKTGFPGGPADRCVGLGHITRLQVTAVRVRFPLAAGRLIWPLGDGRSDLDLLQGKDVVFPFSVNVKSRPHGLAGNVSSVMVIRFPVGVGGGRSVSTRRAPDGPSGFYHFLVFPVHLLGQQPAFGPYAPECV